MFFPLPLYTVISFRDSEPAASVVYPGFSLLLLFCFSRENQGHTSRKYIYNISRIPSALRPSMNKTREEAHNYVLE